MPLRFRDLIAILKAHDVEVTPGAKHWKCSKPGFRPYAIPAHNGEKTELSDKYVRGASATSGSTTELECNQSGCQCTSTRTGR